MKDIKKVKPKKGEKTKIEFIKEDCPKQKSDKNEFKKSKNKISFNK